MFRTALLLALLLLLPIAQGAQILQDGEGDASASVEGQEIPLDRAQNVDVRSLGVSESEEGVRFVLGHGELPDPGVVLVDGYEFQVHFRHEDRWFLLLFEHWYPVAEPSGYGRATLYASDETGAELEPLLEPELQRPSGTEMAATVPHDLLSDLQGVPLQSGRMLQDFRVVGRNSDFIGVSVNDQRIDSRVVHYRDAMPDEGHGETPFPSERGLAQVGLGLHSATPLRWSNGQATAYAYSVEVEELDGRDQHVTFTPEGVPLGWTVVVPEPVHLPAGGNASVDVVAHVPFAHDHGATATFRLLAHDAGNNSLGRIDLGVHYPETPQPTGHHDTVYMHGRDRGENLLFDAVNTALGQDQRFQAFMNTDPEHADDEGVPVPGDKSSLAFDEDGRPRNVYSWRIPLDPGLRMGLDLDEGAESAASFTFETDVDLVEARLEGWFWVGGRGLRDVRPSYADPPSDTLAILDPVDQEAGTEVTFATTVRPVDVVDRVPFQEDQQLYLDLFVLPLRPEAPLSPALGVDLRGGEAQLPLQEYHDAVTVALSETQQELVKDTAPDATPDEGAATRETPGTGAALAVAAVGLAVAARRRT